MSGRINSSGLVIAVIGFLLTRFTVTLALTQDPLRFYLAGVVPLSIGLGIAAFGVALTVADVDAALVRTTAIWCVIGVSTMLALVILTLLGTSPGVLGDVEAMRSQTYLSNFLIGGAVGGTLTGLYAARNRRQRDELRRQTNRLLTLNRLLRHEVLNAVSVIQGYATIDGDPDRDPNEVIAERSDAIQAAVERVTDLTLDTKYAAPSVDGTTLADRVGAAVETIEARYNGVSVTVTGLPEDVRVGATTRLTDALEELLENAVVHGEDRTPTLEVTVAPAAVTIAVADEGPGLPERQRALLERGDVEEFDNPTTGFGLNVVRLLVEEFGGTIRVEREPPGTTVALTLPRLAEHPTAIAPNRTDFANVRPALPHLLIGVGAATVAAIGYGIVAEVLGGSIAAIGVFYGTQHPVVGWLTHEFHSVVFALIYLGLLSVTVERYGNRPAVYLATGMGWAIAVWLGAASVIAPTWLQLLGIVVPIPNFSGRLLAAHAAWGLVLSGVTYLGYGYGARWLSPVVERMSVKRR